MNGRSISILLVTFLASLAFIPPAAAQKDLAVVVNPGNPIANVSLGELRKLFNGEKRSWPGGMAVKFLNLSETDYKQHWTALVVRGEADTEPFAAPSIGMVLEAVRALPGAISLVYVGDLKPGVKVIKIDGLLPGAPGYLLR
jgi:hypothetical protein